MKRFIPILVAACWIVILGVALHRAQAQLMLNAQIGAPPNATPAPTPTPPPGVTLHPGDNLTTAISGNPAGTRFNLACTAGNGTSTYRFATDNTNYNQLQPLAGDSFIGANGDGSFPAGLVTSVPGTAPCADLTGAIRIPTDSPDNAWHASGGLWHNTVGSSNTLSSPAGACISVSSGFVATGGCSYPQDLFFNSVIHPRITAGDNGTPDAWPPTTGYWYFDITGKHGAANTIYVADNPTGITVELSVVQIAFAGSNGSITAPITIQNLTFEKFASSYQNAAITNAGDYWTDENNWFTHNHGYGVELRPSGSQTPHNNTVTYNEFIENGQAGMGDGADINSTFSHNQLDRNGEVSFTYGGEGGNKWVGTGITISNNTVNYEGGYGLWCDVSCQGTQFLTNTITGAAGQGLRDEQSHSVTIQNNTLSNNMQFNNNLCVANHVPIFQTTATTGMDCCTGPQTGTCGTGCNTTASGGGSEMAIALSDNATVGGSGNGNTITSNCGGIEMNAGVEGNGALTTNNVITYNALTYTGSASTVPSKYGMGGFASGGSTSGDVFDHNTYKFNGSGAGAVNNSNWAWSATAGSIPTLSFSGWQAVPQDANGSKCSSC